MAALTDLAAHALAAAIARGEVSCREVMQATLARIAALNPRHNAIVSLRDGDELLREADARDARAAAQTPATSRGWLHGMPQAIKDTAQTAGIRTHARLAAAQGLRAGRGRAAGAADEGGRLHRHRQDQHAGVRPRLAHLQRGVRRDAQRVRPHASRPAAAAAAPRSRSPRACCRWPTAATSWGACATRRRGTTCSACVRARAACRAGRRRTSGSRSSAPKGRWRAPSATSRCCSTCRPATTRACRCRSRASRRSRRGCDELRRAQRRSHRLARRPRRPPGDGARHPRHAAKPALAPPRGRRLRGRADRARLRARAALAGLAGVARRWLVAARIAPHLAKPENRALIKPEALWEHDQAPSLSGAQMMQASVERSAFYQQMLTLFERFDFLALPTTQVWPFAGRRALAEVDRRPRRWTPTTAGWRWRSTPRSPACRASACRSASTPTGLPMGMQLIGRPRGDLKLLRLARDYERVAADVLAVRPAE